MNNKKLIIILVVVIAVTLVSMLLFKVLFKKSFTDGNVNTSEVSNLSVEQEVKAKYPNVILSDQRVIGESYNKTQSGYEILQTVDAPVEEILPLYYSKFDEGDWIVVERPEEDNQTEQRFVVTDENVTITVMADKVGEDTEVSINIEG